MTVTPVYLDGPLAGLEHPVTDEMFEQGSYAYGPNSIYTFSRVMVFSRVIDVASVVNGIPDQALLFGKLMSDSAQAAAE
jgi:hypothetical protein